MKLTKEEAYQLCISEPRSYPRNRLI